MNGLPNQGHSSLLPWTSIQSEMLNAWISRGLISKLTTSSGDFLSTSQYNRLLSLTQDVELDNATPLRHSLFPGASDVQLGSQTLISAGLSGFLDERAYENLLAQLLPIWTEQSFQSASLLNPSHIAFGSLELTTRSEGLAERVGLAQRRTDALLRSRATQFSRSAHYMGSKASLAPFLAEILHTYIDPDATVVDLMCGSGAAAGTFSHYWKTLASDAQAFSRHLAIVQGGGMTGQEATHLADHVLSHAREHFYSLPDALNDEIAKELEFLSAELSSDTTDRLCRWIADYSRVGNLFESSRLDAQVVERRSNPRTRPYLLFSSYYANLFFGVRQSAEIDSLRFAIDQIADLRLKKWAMGALICAVSSCSYTYGGHFAQPRLDGSNADRMKEQARELLVSRGLSVSHEFYVRLTSLGIESESVKFPVETIDGPWENALRQASTMRLGSACVYLDPPYTRDEYSRYYHVLETLVRYDYPLVSGKPSIPKRGDSGRFASAFSTRSVALVERNVAAAISACLDLGWSCLWSYSSSGMASINSVLSQVGSRAEEIEIFSMDHTYKAQGKHRAKDVKEYVIFIR